ncbi:hypothetical protein C8R43DRAFT_1047691 [Mycena crocata]|nr:hypothetical protein C8R43DRAFT_1047691 [Mycena crocata]
MHYNRQPFECIVPTCGRAFSVRSNAVRHMRTHNPLPVLATSSVPEYAVTFAPNETVSSYTIPTPSELIWNADEPVVRGSL